MRVARIARYCCISIRHSTGLDTEIGFYSIILLDSLFDKLPAENSILRIPGQ